MYMGKADMVKKVKKKYRQVERLMNNKRSIKNTKTKRKDMSCIPCTHLMFFHSN